MMWAVKQICVPINYLRIKHGERFFYSKRVYDFVLPILAAILTMWLLGAVGITLSIDQNPEMAKRINDLLTLMIVFYMAALAAVATFERKGIDTPLKGGDATLYVMHADGKRRSITLSHRQFICYLFGYLSFLSLGLFLFLMFYGMVWHNFEEQYKKQETINFIIHNFLDPAIMLIFFVALWQLVFTSFLGIYFLTDRLQVLDESER